MKNEVTQDEIVAVVQHFRKGKGKGKGKGKKGAYWNHGESDHYSRDCLNDKQDNSWTDGGTWKNQKGSKAGKYAGKGCDAGKSNWNCRRNSKAEGKYWYGHSMSQVWQGQNRENDWSTPAWKDKSNIKGSSKGSIYSVDEASDRWTQSVGSQPGSQPEEEIQFCMLSESRLQSQRCEVHEGEDASSDPVVPLEYLASGETQDRPGSVLVQKSGHVDDDVHALDVFYEMDGRKSRYIGEVLDWYRGEDALNLKRSELNELV